MCSSCVFTHCPFRSFSWSNLFSKTTCLYMRCGASFCVRAGELYFCLLSSSSTESTEMVGGSPEYPALLSQNNGTGIYDDITFTDEAMRQRSLLRALLCCSSGRKAKVFYFPRIISSTSALISHTPFCYNFPHTHSPTPQWGTAD